jgi:DNA-binding transcriptional ArsR family regulator
MGRTLPQAARSTDNPDSSATGPTAAAFLSECGTPERRIVLRTLAESGPLTLESLAEHLVASRQGIPLREVPDDARERAVVGLYHTHLQRLSEAGFVEHDGDGEHATVSLGTAVDADRVRDLIERCEGSWTPIEALLSADRRRHVVTMLTTAERRLPVDELAEAVAVLEHGDVDAFEAADVDALRTSLHHVHLPQLDDAGVVDYDPDSRTVGLVFLPEVYRDVVADGPQPASA